MPPSSPHVNRTPESRVFVMDFVNPFPTLWDPAAPRDALWWDSERTFSERSFPLPEAVFQDVDLILLPEHPIQFATASALRRLYEP